MRFVTAIETRAAALGVALRAQIELLAHELHLPQALRKTEPGLLRPAAGLDASQTVDPALERAGLAHRADDDVSGFSRGMRQRLALERALLHRPRLVLLDEPFRGLDDRAVTVVAERLSRLAAEVIIILATHDLDVADGLATRVTIIRDGRMVAGEQGGSDLRHEYRAMVGGS